MYVYYPYALVTAPLYPSKKGPTRVNPGIEQ